MVTHHLNYRIDLRNLWVSRDVCVCVHTPVSVHVIFLDISCFCLPTCSCKSTRIIALPYCELFYMGCEELNSGHLACTPNNFFTILTKHLPVCLFNYWLLRFVIGLEIDPYLFLLLPLEKARFSQEK